MKGESVYDIAKTFIWKAGELPAGFRFGRMCPNIVEQAIRDVATDTILFHESRAK
jgi:hypothetical protein